MAPPKHPWDDDDAPSPIRMPLEFPQPQPSIQPGAADSGRPPTADEQEKWDRLVEAVEARVIARLCELEIEYRATRDAELIERAIRGLSNTLEQKLIGLIDCLDLRIGKTLDRIADGVESVAAEVASIETFGGSVSVSGDIQIEGSIEIDNPRNREGNRIPLSVYRECD